MKMFIYESLRLSSDKNVSTVVYDKSMLNKYIKSVLLIFLLGAFWLNAQAAPCPECGQEAGENHQCHNLLCHLLRIPSITGMFNSGGAGCNPLTHTHLDMSNPRHHGIHQPALSEHFRPPMVLPDVVLGATGGSHSYDKNPPMTTCSSEPQPPHWITDRSTNAPLVTEDGLTFRDFNPLLHAAKSQYFRHF